MAVHKQIQEKVRKSNELETFVLSMTAYIYIYTLSNHIDRYNVKNTNCVDCIHDVSVVIVLNSKGK